MPFMMVIFVRGPTSAFLFTFGGTFVLWFVNSVADSLDNPFRKEAQTLDAASVQDGLGGGHLAFGSLFRQPPPLRRHPKQCRSARPPAARRRPASRSQEAGRVRAHDRSSAKAQALSPPIFRLVMEDLLGAPGATWREAGCGLYLGDVWACYTCWADDRWLLATSLDKGGLMLKTLQGGAMRRVDVSLRPPKPMWAAIRRAEQEARDAVKRLATSGVKEVPQGLGRVGPHRRPQRLGVAVHRLNGVVCLP